MLRRIVGGIVGKIRARPGSFAVLVAIVTLATVLVKDNIADAVRSNIQSVEFAKQFYELHVADIDLNTRINEIDDSVEELKLIVSRKEVPSASQELLTRAIQNHNDAVQNTKLIQAAAADTEDLVKHIGDSIFFFTYSDGEEGLLRSNIKLLHDRLDELSSDIKTLKGEWNKVNMVVSVPDSSKYVEACKTFDHDAAAAAIQAANLEDLSRENRLRAVRVAESYRQFLEEGEGVCDWAIILLVVTGAVLGLLSLLAGVNEGPVKNA
jgi:hypothetical protein